MARYRLFTIVACLAIGGCGGGGSPTSPPPPPPAPPAPPPPPPPPEIVFAQVEDAGLDRPYRLETDGLTAAERLSGGIAAGDYDGDGDVDLYVVGGDLDPNSLYENQGDGTFLDTTEEATPVITHKGSGPAFGDIDGDGDLDLFLGAVDGSRYYMLENRDGAFFDETSGSGIELTASQTVSATFFDYDSDGHLDLFLAHWGVSRESGDDTETVWRNRGDGTFGSAGIDTGIAAHIIQGDTDTTFTLNLGDIDGDGDGDLLMTADRGRSQVFLNNGDGSFARTTDPDVIVDQAGSGAVLADYDNDGDLDWFVSSNYSLDITDGDRIGNRLYRNTGAGEFEDATDAANVADGGWGWGTCAADFDNDGNLDIFQVNGWGEELGKDFGDDPVRLFYSQGDGTFEERAADFGLDDAGQGRGVACFDAERDGDIDIVLTNASADHIVYYRNDTDNDHHYLGVKVKALGGNTFGVGALVEARTSDGVQIRTVGGGNNYASHDPLEAHFGLGAATTADIRVVWPDGEVSRENDVAADQIVTLEQPLPRLRLGVRQGRGTGFYTEGDAVEIEALQPISGYYFSHWSSSGGGAFQDAFSTSTTFVMPADSVTITANYVPGVPPDEDFSVARRWNEALLQSIRNDFARPVVHARNLFHVSAAMYDVWAAYGDLAVPWLLGRARAGETCAFDAAALAVPDDPEALRTAREEAMSFAAYRLIAHRFTRAPVSGNRRITRDIDALMGYLARRLDFDADNDSADYGSGSPGALGNHVAECYIDFGMADGANEAADYANTAYMPLNPPLEPHLPGNPDIVDLNRWQPLSLREFIDQSGNAVTGTIEHLGPEWGQVVPFALSETDLMRYQRPGETFDYWVYHDPGPPPTIDGSLSDNYKWNHALVAIWSSHLDPDGADGAECEEGSTESGCRGAQRIDISPASLGNIGTESYPTAFEDYPAFYKDEGGDPGTGYDVNPATGEPYEPQMVPLGDYARVLAEFWADGPDSETPPGHWFVILNEVNDHPLLERRFEGSGPELTGLEWDIKAYFMMGGAMHDAAIAAWGIKGWYDYIRPISAIRAMADRGQSSDPNQASYDIDGIPLSDGYVELVEADDALAGVDEEHVGKIKLLAWRGPDFIGDPRVDAAGVGWILAENWWPYQRPSFVTPPFAGYVSGHSTYSRTAAELLTLLTGDAYFPGGMSSFEIAANQFLVFEEGPSVDMVLQWATYRDASDQTSLSRIWGGIHPPADDIPGRLIGLKLGPAAFDLASDYFNGTVEP